MIYDTIIVGLGAMGSAAAFHLARKGARVLGLDRYRPPHGLGSSHGHSRIIRQAYFEHPQYVPLVRRAYECWSELEALSGQPLFVRTGGLMIGAPDGDVVRGALLSAREHGLKHELLSSVEIRARYPVFKVPDDAVGVWEPDAGFLRPESCVAAHLRHAETLGASLHYDEPAISWSAEDSGVRVVTARDRYLARHLVIAAGAWTAQLAQNALPPLVIERCVQHWFQPAYDPSRFDSNHFPVFIWEYDRHSTWYGIPSDAALAAAPGVKLALHHQGATSETAERVSREITDDDEAAVRVLVRRFLPDADGPVSRSTVCLYTNTPDEDFVIDAPAGSPQTIIVSACSGHGFKFSSAIGEAVAELVLDGRSTLDLTPFRLARFS